MRAEIAQRCVFSYHYHDATALSAGCHIGMRFPDYRHFSAIVRSLTQIAPPRANTGNALSIMA